MSLGQELVAIALGYARARFTELRTAVLADADAFAQALGPGATAAQVAAHLDLAKAAFDAAGSDLDARNLVASANQFGIGVNELNEAAKAAGADLRPVLLREIGWTNADPQGLAGQLGLPDSPSDLKINDGALVYTLTAPERTILPVPTVKFDKLELTARLRIDPLRPGPPLTVSISLEEAEIGIGGGPIASLLGGASGTAQSTIILGFDTDRGLTLSGSASPRVVLPARPALGPIDIREITLELPPGVPDTVDVGGTFTADLGGVIKATVTGAGVHLHVDPDAALGRQQPTRRLAEGPDRDRPEPRHRAGPRRRIPRRPTGRLRRRVAIAARTHRRQGGRPADRRAELRPRRGHVGGVHPGDRPELRLHPERGGRHPRHRASAGHRRVARQDQRRRP